MMRTAAEIVATLEIVAAVDADLGPVGRYECEIDTDGLDDPEVEPDVPAGGKPE